MTAVRCSLFDANHFHIEQLWLLQILTNCKLMILYIFYKERSIQIYFIFFIYTIFQEGNIFSLKASLPYGPLNIDNKYNISNVEINKQKYIHIYKQVRYS